MENADHMIRGLLAEAERKRAAAREREARARHEADMFTVEVEAYKKALSALGQVSNPTPEIQKEASAPRVPRAKTAIVGGNKWLEVYARLTETTLPPYSYEAIARAAKDVGHDVSEGGFRAQMMNAVNAGLFTRVGPGMFVATEQGLDLFGPRGQSNAASGNAAKANVEEAGGFFDVLNPNPAQ